MYLQNSSKYKINPSLPFSKYVVGISRWSDHESKSGVYVVIISNSKDPF